MTNTAMPADGRAARALARSGQWAGPTAGMAPGFVQANLVLLPAQRPHAVHAPTRLKMLLTMIRSA